MKLGEIEDMIGQPSKATMSYFGSRGKMREYGDTLARLRPRLSGRAAEAGVPEWVGFQDTGWRRLIAGSKDTMQREIRLGHVVVYLGYKTRKADRAG